MAQPSPYNRAFNFSNYQAQNPTLPLPGAQVDIELSRLKAVTDEIRSVIAALQRDDLALSNRSVGYDQLKTEVNIGVNPPSSWATATNYIARDSVFKDQKFYICETSHVSGTFATDLATGKWELIADFTAAQAASLVTYDNGTSGLTATNMQDAMDELVASIAVQSVFGRSGTVTATAGDYDADQIDFDPTGLAHTNATDLQEAIADHDAAIAGRAASSHTHAQSDITNLTTDLAAKVPTSRTISVAGLATGGGDLSAGRTITVAIASQAEAEAGSANDKAMTPLRVKQAIDALAGIDYQAFTASGTWAKPSGTTASSRVLVQAWGAGGAGNTTSAGSNNGGGGGGAYREKWFMASDLASSVSVTIGAGGVKSEPGGSGGASSFGALLSAPGGSGGSNSGGGAGGTGFTFWAGGSGGYASSAAGSVAYGGGGGGGEATNTTGGTSLQGGDGGDAGSAGSAPGGGGGWNANGARGEVRVTTFI